jgi:hypothetical protein
MAELKLIGTNGRIVPYTLCGSALSRHIFRAPTRFYKSGIVFMAWLNDHQDHFVMVNGQQSARSLAHYCELFRLADQAGLLLKPELAVGRMRSLLAVYGVGA